MKFTRTQLMELVETLKTVIEANYDACYDENIEVSYLDIHLLKNGSIHIGKWPLIRGCLASSTVQLEVDTPTIVEDLIEQLEVD